MTLAVADSTRILDKWLEATQDASKCSVCFSSLVGAETWIICDCPEVNTGKKDHVGHTACNNCVESLAYVGEGASCVACLRDLGRGVTRATIKQAGIAKRPAVKNQQLDMVLSKYAEAEDEVGRARQVAEEARLREGPDRRAQALEEQRLRRLTVAQEQLQVETEARLIVEGKVRQLEERLAEAQEKNKKNDDPPAPRAAMEAAREEAPRAAREEAPRAAREEAPRAAREEAPRAVREEAPKKRRRGMSEDANAKRKATFAKKRDMLEEHPILVANVAKLKRQVTELSMLLFHEVSSLGAGQEKMERLQSVVQGIHAMEDGEEEELEEEEEEEEEEEPAVLVD